MYLANLRGALSDLYPDADDAQRIGGDADLDTRRIDYGGSAFDFWQATLDEAEFSSKLLDLLDVAIGEYPTNDDLLLAAWTYIRDVASIQRGVRIEPDRSRRLDRHDERLDQIEQRLTRAETAGVIVAALVVAIGSYLIFIL